MIGKIIKQISNDYTVKIDNKVYVCKARGKFRNENISPKVGDNVEIDIEKNYILSVNERHNELDRPVIANVDQAVIVMSTTIPSFSLELLDRLITIIEYNHIKPIIYVSKLDLLSIDKVKKIKECLKYYEHIGYKVFTDLSIKKIFKDQVTVFVGQSGAGKSTLLNKLDNNLNLKTGEVSVSLGRGRHTTRHVELIECLDGLIADTPGFSKIDFNGMTKTDIRDNFVEFNKYRDKCQYKDCMHYNEDDCEIKRQLNKEILSSRYNNYLKFMGVGNEK